MTEELQKTYKRTGKIGKRTETLVLLVSLLPCQQRSAVENTVVSDLCNIQYTSEETAFNRYHQNTF